MSGQDNTSNTITRIDTLGTYNVKGGEYVFLVFPPGPGSVVIPMPPATPGRRAWVYVGNGNGVVHLIPGQGSGTIDGATDQIIGQGSRVLLFDGSNWFTVGTWTT